MRTQKNSEKSSEMKLTDLVAGEILMLPRLTTAIYLVCRAREAKYVVVPNNCCPQIVYATILAGAVPVFCEIDLQTGGFDINSLMELIALYPLDLLIHIHLYGVYNPRKIIHEICRSHNMYFFEDGGLWFPPNKNYELLPNSCLGLSFGTKKIFDFGGGAALYFSDKETAGLVKTQFVQLEYCPTGSSNYSEKYYRIVSELAGFDEQKICIDNFAFEFKNSWIGLKPIPRIEITNEEIACEKNRRYELAENYKKALMPLITKCLDKHELNFLWRYSFLTPKANQVATFLRSCGVEVSHWYPCLDRLFFKYPASFKLTNSRQFEREVCNLWLDTTVDHCKTNLLFDGVKKYIEGYPS